MQIFINTLTLSRIISAPIIFICIAHWQYFGIAILLFVLASISDFFDGFLARHYQLTSELGKILDPISDKILIVFGLIGIALYLESFYVAITTSFILARELWVSALRELNAINSNSKATDVSFLAKIKTTIQFISIAGYILGLYMNLSFLVFLSNFILFLALLITLITGLEYTKNSFGLLAPKE